MSIESFLKRNKYKALSLSLSTKGDFSPKDSEWNYSDITHANFIHSRIEVETLSATPNQVSHVWLQKIGPFTFPTIVFIGHDEAAVHSYTTSILNIVIHVRTFHQGQGLAGQVLTNYSFYYRSLLGLILSRIARMAIRQNYTVLNSEDAPMRDQRGSLRNRGITFSFDEQELIGFSDTINIHEDHVQADQLRRFSNTFKLELSTPSGFASVDDFLLQLSWSQGLLQIFPLICSHEGAPLNLPCSKAEQHLITGLTCPWHGRQHRPLLELSLKTAGIHRFDFCLQNIQIELTPSQEPNPGLYSILISLIYP